MGCTLDLLHGNHSFYSLIMSLWNSLLQGVVLLFGLDAFQRGWDKLLEEIHKLQVFELAIDGSFVLFCLPTPD